MLAAGIVKQPAWDDLGVEMREIQIPARDAASLRAVVYRPLTTAPGPLAVYFHGGGWTFGWPESWEHGFAVLTAMGITCVGVAYRLAPEHVFPTAANDARDSLEWCVEHAGTLGADPEMGVVVLGTSAGANLAAVASHEAVERGWGERVRGVVLVGAGLVHFDAVPEEWREHQKSWEQNRDAPILDVRGVKWFFGKLDLLEGGRLD
jgi:acetyl esterase/lipase